MKKFQFLLLDAGPIIKLFEMDIWDRFIKSCDVTIARTVVEEAERNIKKLLGICANLESYGQQNLNLIRIVDVELSVIKEFYDRFDLIYKGIIDPGEKETLAFVSGAPANWLVCSADHAVFSVLGLLGKGQQGISLEEVLLRIGLSKSNLEWQYIKNFRERYTRMCQVYSIQGKGFH
jgi:hypothetical protein